MGPDLESEQLGKRKLLPPEIGNTREEQALGGGRWSRVWTGRV